MGGSSIYVISATHQSVPIGTPGWHVRKFQPDDSSDFGLQWPGAAELPMAMWYVVPLWLPLAVVAIPTAVMFYRDRRRTGPGYCATCGYDLTGNITGRCPECGTPI